MRVRRMLKVMFTLQFSSVQYAECQYMKLTKFKLTFKKAKKVIIETRLQFYSSVQYSSLNVSIKLRR